MRLFLAQNLQSEQPSSGCTSLADCYLYLEHTPATADAATSLKKLLAKDWPSRFGSVHNDARNKLVQLEKKAG